MAFPIHLLRLFVAAMVISSIGFKNYVWFISLEYGFSIAGEGVLVCGIGASSVGQWAAPLHFRSTS